MRVPIPRYLLVLWLLLLLTGWASAQDAPYRRLQLAHGISLEVPTHWDSLSVANRQNLRAAGDALMDNAGIEKQTGTKEPLLAMNATPAPHGAMIRVSVSTPAPYSQAELAEVTTAELHEAGGELLQNFKRLEGRGGPKLTQMQATRVETINGARALVFGYVRVGTEGKGPWQVTQYKIPVGNRLIEMTLSHRLSDAVVWRPILERVKGTLRF